MLARRGWRVNGFGGGWRGRSASRSPGASQGRRSHRPAGLDERLRRPPDPQGQVRGAPLRLQNLRSRPRPLQDGRFPSSWYSPAPPAHTIPMANTSARIEPTRYPPSPWEALPARVLSRMAAPQIVTMELTMTGRFYTTTTSARAAATFRAGGEIRAVGRASGQLWCVRGGRHGRRTSSLSARDRTMRRWARHTRSKR